MSEFDTGLGTTPGMWEMVSEALEGVALPEPVSQVITALRYGKAKVQKDGFVRQVLGTRAADLAASQAREKALLIERDFWVEQGRSLQNQLQTWQRMYSGLYDQIGRGVVTEESISENLAMASEELRQPITTVEAVRALTAGLKDNTQGQYTSVKGGRGTKKLEKRHD